MRALEEGWQVAALDEVVKLAQASSASRLARWDHDLNELFARLNELGHFTTDLVLLVQPAEAELVLKAIQSVAFEHLKE